MRSSLYNIALVIGVGGAVGLSAAAAAAGEADLNPVFAQLPQMDEGRLDRTRGLGSDVITLESEFATTVTDTTITTNGGNTIADGAFEGSQVFAAVVQNTGSFVSVQNQMTVNVNITD